MSIKVKILISMLVMGFLAAATVIVANALLLSFLIDSRGLGQKIDTISYFIFTGILVTIVFVGVSIPVILYIANSISKPVGKILEKTHYDSLTGVFNRRYVDENLKKLIGFMSRSELKLTVFIISIDFFKEYNDKYGYNAGDNCLKTIATSLAKSVSRSEDFVARYGGKEFVVVLPNTDESGAGTMANKMLEVIKGCKIPHETNSAADCVTISIGAVTGKTAFTQNVDDYITRANKMLIKSMQDGCNRYTLDTF